MKKKLTPEERMAAKALKRQKRLEKLRETMRKDIATLRVILASEVKVKPNKNG